jgi:hypothetical protein
MAAEHQVPFPKSITVWLATAAAAAAICGGGGAAFGYWTSHGTGTAVVATSGGPATVHLIAVTGGNTASTSLSPGQTADLVLELNNPNAYPVTIVSITQTGNVSPSGGTGPGAACTGSTGNTGDTTGVSVPTQTVSLAVASGPQVVVHLPGGASMNTTSASGCQGASFQIPVTVTVQR